MSEHIKNNEQKKQNLRNTGFAKEVERIELGECPFCGNKVKQEDFRDKLSLKEFHISGMCQECMDNIFI